MAAAVGHLGHLSCNAVRGRHTHTHAREAPEAMQGNPCDPNHTDTDTDNGRGRRRKAGEKVEGQKEKERRQRRRERKAGWR